MKITILCATNNWIYDYAFAFGRYAEARGHQVIFIEAKNNISRGDLCFFFNVPEIIPDYILNLNSNNIVIHASDLPKNKGWSPYIYSILANETRFPVSLIEAKSPVDSGDIYIQEWINLEGHELLEEIYHKIGEAAVIACIKLISMKLPLVGRPQVEEGNICPRRTPAYNELDVDASLAQQFNLLRVSHNTKFPAWFIFRGHKYILKIEKARETK